ncbi:MAG: Ig-like domain-containing protein [Limisphaerales bacterium]
MNSLKTRTTFSPVVYANTTISSDDFNSQVQRDTYAPDLGYHYDALDYVFENCQVNSSMTFPAGTAVGWQGQGLSFSAGYSINFNGTAASPCYFVRVNTVQEADSSGDGTGMTDSNGNGWPSMNAVFTRFSALGNTAAFFNANSFYVSAYNCEFWNGLLGGNVTGGLQLYCYNCLFDRSFIGFETTINSPYGYLYLWNCTLHGGTLSMDNLSNNAYHNVYDSAFDGTTLEADGVYGDAAYNAYLSGADTLPNDHDDVTVPGSFNWQDGLFGSFYLPSASPLIDAGTYSASSISDWTGYTSTTLATFTTQTSEAPEGDTTVDIGYHYPALLAWAGNQPLCPNGTLHLNNYNSNPDVFGSPLTYSVVSSPAHGSLSGTPSDLIYTPDSCYEGDDSFTYKISDGLLTSPPATVTLTMADQATAYPPSVQTCRDTTSDQFTLGGSDNCGETLTYSILSNPTHGYLTLIGSPTDPVYTYTPNNPSGYTGTDSFEYQVANGCGNSDTATVTITVGDANLCPNNQTAMTGVNQAINLTLTANDNDSCKDDPLTYTITANPLHGSVTPSSGTGAVQYTPATDYEGIDTFTFTVSDGTWNAQCSDAQVTIFVVKGPTLTTFCRPDRIVLNWSLDSVVQNMEDNYTDGFYIQDFKVYRATSPGGPYTLISSPSIDTRTYVDTDVTAESKLLLHSHV